MKININLLKVYYYNNRLFFINFQFYFLYKADEIQIEKKKLFFCVALRLNKKAEDFFELNKYSLWILLRGIFNLFIFFFLYLKILFSLCFVEQLLTKARARNNAFIQNYKIIEWIIENNFQNKIKNKILSLFQIIQENMLKILISAFTCLALFGSTG